MKLLKCSVALTLIIAMILGLLPTGIIGDAILLARAEAEIAAAVDHSDMQSVLNAAEAAKAAGLERVSGVWRFIELEKEQWAVITGHTDLNVTSVEVPDLVDGLDVVGITDNALTGHSRLTAVAIPGNVFAIGPNALQRGAAVKAANAAYAQTWARKNGHAFENISQFEFRAGVIDFAGIRPENFVRISEKEIMLRTLEAKRIAVGKRFFLLDESNPYQISYYQATEISEPSNGFVTVYCDTPDASDIVLHISGTNEDMGIDPNSIELAPGVTFDSNASRISGSVSVKPNFNIGPLTFKSPKKRGVSSRRHAVTVLESHI